MYEKARNGEPVRLWMSGTQAAAERREEVLEEQIALVDLPDRDDSTASKKNYASMSKPLPDEQLATLRTHAAGRKVERTATGCLCVGRKSGSASTRPQA